MGLFLAVLLAAGPFMLPAGALAGDDPLFGNMKNDPSQPWHITADHLQYDDKAEQYIGKGNVVINKQGRRLTADFVRFDKNTLDVFAAGHAVMTAGRDIISGDRMEMNLKTETGTVYDGYLFISESHFYINGDTLQKLSEKTYAADRASVTSCKGDNPDWVVTARNLKVTIDGMGMADHATLWAKKVPVFYTPFIAFPAKKDRQTGFLFPQFGFSDRKGFEYNQPFFWAINESSDATFFYHHMQDRGEKFGAEYRYIIDNDSQGAVMIDGFKDDKIDDGTLENSDWGYSDDSYVRTNKDRYWFRMKHDQQLPHGFTAKLDLDIVSDQDYLHEFRDSYAGFDESDEYFTDHFGRDLEDWDDAVRLNRLNINNNWSYYTFNADIRWYDDVINRQLYDTNTILQKLPSVEFNASKHSIMDSPVYWDLDSEYTFFYREDADQAHRIDVYPRVYLPTTWRNFLSFEPSVGVRQTFWRVEKDSSGNDADSDLKDRTIYDFKADLSSEIFRVYKFDNPRLVALKHTIRPQVVYNYIPEEDQSEYPYYDGIDRIYSTNTVTYSVTTILTSKSKAEPAKETEALLTDAQEPEPGDPGNDYTYREFCRLKIQQTYDIEEARETGDTEPFSDIYAELNFAPLTYVSLKADASFSPYESHFTTHNVAANLTDKRGDRLAVEHRYTRDASESLNLNLRLQITDRLSTYTEYEKNLYDDEDIRTRLGLLYKAACWSLKCDFTKEEDDRQFVFMITLYGLGEFGKKFALPSTADPVEYN